MYNGRPQFEQAQSCHAYNRGFCKRPIFKNARDKDRFLSKAMFYSEKYDVSIEATAILANHFHFILKQNNESGIKDFLTCLQLSYAKYYNRKYSRRGPVFEGRYHAILITDEHYRRNIFNYVLYNPCKG